MLTQITRVHKVLALFIGVGIGVLIFVPMPSSPTPTTVVELLPISEWGYGSLPAGSAYYLKPRVTCVIAYGQSHRYGCIRVVSNIQYASILSIKPIHLPRSAR